MHAAIEETFRLSVAEALACGTPVVTASDGGVLEYLEDSRTAFIVPPRDFIRLAGVIGRLLDDPGLGAKVGAEAVQVHAHLDARTMVAALHSWCAEVHGSWTVPPPIGDRRPWPAATQPSLLPTES